MEFSKQKLNWIICIGIIYSMISRLPVNFQFHNISKIIKDDEKLSVTQNQITLQGPLD